MSAADVQFFIFIYSFEQLCVLSVADAQFFIFI